MNFTKMKYDVFISYRREGGYDTAKHLNDLLVRDGYKVSFDIDTLRSGDFDTQLLERIDQCEDFVLIIDQHAFDRTLDSNFNPKNDWMRCELAYALQQKKNIIPVFLSGVTGFPANLPEDIAGVTTKNGPEYNRYYFNDFYKTLKSRFLHKKGKYNSLTNILLLIVVVAASFMIYNYYNESEGNAEENEVRVDNQDEKSDEIELQYANKSYEIELFTVVNTYVQAYEQSEYNNVDWGVFAQKPLTPLTRSFESAPEESGYPNVLKFKGKLQYNKTPLTIYKTGEAADWIVSLYGPNAAPMMMRIEPGEDGEFGGEELITNAVAVAKQVGFTLVWKKEDMGSYCYLYQKGGLFLLVTASCGSAGVMLDLTISTDMDDINRYDPNV